MHGLPRDFDPRDFVGKTVQSVGFSANTVDVGFETGESITTESPFEHTGPQINVCSGWHDVPVQCSELMRVAGRTVVGAKVVGRGTLVLAFDDGQSLTFQEDDQPYESYRVIVGGREFIV